MTRNEAIKYIRNVLSGREDKRGKTEIDIALEMAIKALEQEHCEDVISRQAAISVVEKWFKKIGLNPDICIDGLISLPPVTPQPKMGRWVKDKCSICEEERAWYGLNPPYCPDCGSYNGGDAE